MKKRKQRVAVIYHGYCSDGYSAALISKQALVAAGCEVSLFPARHGTAPHPAVFRHDGIIVVDFCYPENIMDSMAQAMGPDKFLCLDHHETASRIMAGKPWAVYDVERSGAQLAWDHFNEGKPYPKVVNWIADRDLWKWRHPESRAFGRALAQMPWDEARWLALLSATDEELRPMVEEGMVLDKYIQRISVSMARKATPLTILGHDGWAVEAPGLFASDVGAVLSDEKGSFAAVWQVAEAGTVLDIRLRSASEEYNMAKLAEQYGGGGHARAAGFRLATDALPSFLSGSL